MEKLDLSAKGWQERYEAGKTGWDRGGSNPILMRWLAESVVEPCRLLVPGCGRGHEVVTLAQHGFEVTALDFASSAVEHLRERLGAVPVNANVLQSDILQYVPDEPFDAIYEQTCLCAIDPTQWKAYEQQLTRWLRPGGMLLALFMQSGQRNQPPFTCEIQAMRNLFDKTCWSWTGEPMRVEHPTGMHELACILKRENAR